ncbi:MAG: exodeoxyribonuclease VII small subunit [Bacteroidaceae bacterium]|nr:exodeoxyribonuclease VII small subunit [Bacteroidaceae bacterium]
MKDIKTYSEAIARLESIMSQINGGNVDIDTLSDCLREAQELINFCRDKLFKVDEYVKKILESIEAIDNE